MSENSRRKLAAVVLAAGAARRFGKPKQLERWPHPNSPTLVERATSLVLEAGFEIVYVITGNKQEDVAKALESLSQEHNRLQISYNPRWEEGQGYSVAAGVAAVQKASAEITGILFMLADQPRIKLETIRILAKEFQEIEQPEATILFPVYAAKRGNPVIFGYNFFDELCKLEGDTGGRAIVKKHLSAVREIEVNDPAIHEDVDTSADLAALSEGEG